MELSTKVKSMAVSTSSKLLVVMTDEEIKNKGLFLDNFKLEIDPQIGLLSTDLPLDPEYDEYKIYIYHSKSNRINFRVSDANGIRKWELYPSVISEKDGTGILFVWATKKNIYQPIVNKDFGSIICDYELLLSKAVILELTNLYDLDYLIEYCPSSYYKKRLRWVLDTYLRRVFPFNIPLPKWLS